ncbi:tautomerase family protein [Bradyrhizobium elkanii]|uniref:tautomerase family protein n=1 Tax=Bradyrhizobium elkanii TaxID=29448 RepID=UPI0020A1B9AD|nr:tautomerase family protein [Bradyrhizobium elkanii]MCP1968537.1 phenylpyruvate tautomerase PptA (4-oxalocrotonate tautomerase family) [Bradyrhizobium elkanii]MCS4109962.1 phenylpyruvate tautomerase PptA (4-oxalocrotonate tautomerase family) [Bradyrhizobium elkanii]
MPFWKIYHPAHAFSAADKQALSQSITELYRVLPKFYVIVVFQEVAPDSFYMGGEPANNFIRIWVDHIARSFPPDAKKLKTKWLARVEKALAPFVKDRGRDWEIHIDETPFDLWQVQGLPPPPPNSEYERIWLEANKPVPYPIEEAN